MYWTPLPDISKPHDRYGFVDEREIRIATGIMLILWLFSFFFVVFKAEFQIPLILVSIIVIDFLSRILISPKCSLFGSFVRIFLKKKDAIWVGSVQKRFAWTIGLILSSFTLYCILLLWEFIAPSPGPQMTAVSGILEGIRANLAQGSLIVMPMNPTIIACLLCIIFMWSESVVGYCVGCSLYAWLVKKGWMKSYKWQNCADGNCSI